MLAISAVLVMEPSYVVFDEPMTLLDSRNKKLVLDTIQAIKQPIIMVTHDMDHLRDFERVIVFEDGKVVEDSVPDDAIHHYMRAMG